MHYQISRNGQMYGPYTLEDLQRYLASGNVLPTDLGKSEEMADWVPVAQIVGASAAPAVAAFSTPGFANPVAADPYTQQANLYGQPNPAAALAASTYADPPNLHWGLVLLFGFLTCSLFMWVWNLVVAAWLKRVQPNASSLFFYIGAVILLVLQLTVGRAFGTHVAGHVGLQMYTGNPVGSLLGLAVWVVRLVARFMQRAALEEHFNGPEPIGLQLNPVMTFFFGGIYFQYHINRIMEMKQAARMGMPRAY